MAVRPFILVGAAVRAAVDGGARAAVDAWRAAYGPALDAAAAPCAAAAGPVAEPVRACWRDGQRVLWLAWDDAQVLQCAEALFGPVDGAAVAPDIAAGVLAALAGHLAHALLPATAAMPRAGATAPADAIDPAALAIASGAVQWTINVGAASVRCVLSAAAAAALAPVKAPAKLPALPVLAWRTALADVPVRLTIEAGRAEVGAGSLLHCGPGDVIRLETPADQPLDVRAPGGAHLFYGFLGRAGSHAAVEVTQYP